MVAEGDADSAALAEAELAEEDVAAAVLELVSMLEKVEEALVPEVGDADALLVLVDRALAVADELDEPVASGDFELLDDADSDCEELASAERVDVELEVELMVAVDEDD